jgi:hypothetical protein
MEIYSKPHLLKPPEPDIFSAQINLKEMLLFLQLKIRTLNLYLSFFLSVTLPTAIISNVKKYMQWSHRSSVSDISALYIITTNFLLRTDDKIYAHDDGKYKHFIKERLKLEMNYVKGNTS